MFSTIIGFVFTLFLVVVITMIDLIVVPGQTLKMLASEFLPEKLIGTMPGCDPLRIENLELPSAEVIILEKNANHPDYRFKLQITNPNSEPIILRSYATSLDVWRGCVWYTHDGYTLDLDKYIELQSGESKVLETSVRLYDAEDLCYSKDLHRVRLSYGPRIISPVFKWCE